MAPHSPRLDANRDFDVNEKILQLIGLAIRAGKASTGQEGVMTSIRSGKAQLVVVANDTGGNAKKKYRDKCAFYNISLIERFDKEILGRACGRSPLAVVAISDPGFATKIGQYVGEFGGGEVFDETSSL